MLDFELSRCICLLACASPVDTYSIEFGVLRNAASDIRTDVMRRAASESMALPVSTSMPPRDRTLGALDSVVVPTTIQ